MRAAQRRYFRSRSPGDLEASKALERAPDEALASILDGPTLFDAPSEQDAKGTR